MLLVLDHAKYKRLNKKLDKIIELINNLTEAVKIGNEKMSAELDRMEAEVTRTTSLEESAIVLINGLAGQINALLAQDVLDKAKLAELSSALTARADALAAALVANTPAAPVVDTPPAPPADTSFTG